MTADFTADESFLADAHATATIADDAVVPAAVLKCRCWAGI